MWKPMTRLLKKQDWGKHQHDNARKKSRLYITYVHTSGAVDSGLTVEVRRAYRIISAGYPEP